MKIFQHFSALVAAAFLFGPAAFAGDVSADQDWRAYQAVAEAQAPTSMSSKSPLERARWYEESSLKRRAAALAFIEKYPDDPRRWIIVDRLDAGTPRFVKDWGPLDEGGVPRKPVLDKAAAAAWSAKVEGLKTAIARATDVPEELKASWSMREEERQKYVAQIQSILKGWRGAVAPNFAVRDLAGREVKLSDYRGKIVILDFWATWCGPCLESMPHTQEVAARYKEQDVVILGSCTADTRAAFEKWVNKNQERYPDILWVHDPAEKSADVISKRLYNVPCLPSRFVIDRDGRVVDLVIGYLPDEVILEVALANAGVKVDPALVARGTEQRKKRGF
jgi:thiol-disulfide isomerase/thioredoxin